MGDGDAAEGEVGKQRLNIAQDRIAGRRVAHMADRRAAGKPADRFLGVEIVADLTLGPLDVEMVAIERDDAGGLLAAVLQRVQPSAVRAAASS